jgi:hypothetical protein
LIGNFKNANLKEKLLLFYVLASNIRKLMGKPEMLETISIKLP